MKSPGNRQTGSVQTGTLAQNFNLGKASDANRTTANHVMALASGQQKLARGLLFRQLHKITKGRIVIDEGHEVHQFGENGDDVLTAHLVVTDPAFYQAVVFNGSIGGGESYMKEHWHTHDLLPLVRIMVLNMSVLKGLDRGKSRIALFMNKLLHLRNRNSVAGSRKNISAHYDLSNDFFATFLDPSMMYSSAIFRDDTQTLHEASLNKLSHICERLQLTADDHLLEIGTGWGSMAIHAAKHYGCRVTTTTISREQYNHARQRVIEEGLEDRVELLLNDYRDLQGQYDKLVSIEMIEAVGHEYFATYFAKCSSLLKPSGLMLIQAITISDQRYEDAKRTVDFIQRYIFPGGCLPSNSAIAHHVARDTDLQIVGLEDITQDYAMTLARWRKAFLERTRDIQAQGFANDFIRMWDYYLAYCQGGFMERVIHTAQIVMAKPDYRMAPLHARIQPAGAGQ
ncbi:MAG: cyclopropane-fatty-acyl-phospholipid synthase family protein [Pseudohongiella sp.]|uniref:class I SAM-dependent methyltransferase n=1 Tax=Pseudohongiella sp. TaxID=1979412 RepID=UPI0034A0544A